MNKTIDDLWEAIASNTKLSSRVLLALWQNIQLRESEKVPDDWNSTYAIVGDQLCLPILPHEIRRASLTIQNNGPGVLIISPRFFDTNQVRTQIGTTTTGVVAQYMQIKSGQSVTIGTRGAVYGACLTTASTCELEAVETLFTTPTNTDINRAASAHKPGLAGLLMEGLDPDSEHLAHTGEARKII